MYRPIRLGPACALFLGLFCLAPAALRAQTLTSPSAAPRTPQAHREAAAVLEAKSDRAGAIAEYQAAYAVEWGVDCDTSGVDLNGIGKGYWGLNQYVKSLGYLQQALSFFQQAGDMDKEAETLWNVANDYRGMGQYVTMVSYLQQALIIHRKLGDWWGVPLDLHLIGYGYESLGRFTEAMDYYQQSLILYRKYDDRPSQGTVLCRMGEVSNGLSQYDKSLDYFQQSLTLRQQLGDQRGQAEVVQEIGGSYSGLSQYGKALDCYQQSLTFARKTGDWWAEEDGLDAIGQTYDALGQYARALDYHQQALIICRKGGYVGNQEMVRNHVAEASILINVGQSYCNLSQHAKSLAYFQQALTIFRMMDHRDGVALAMSSLGMAYTGLRQPVKALADYQQALIIYRKSGDRDGEAGALQNSGEAYHSLHQDARALSFYHQALPIEQQSGDKASEAGALDDIMAAWKALKRPGLAIFYGKQAVNAKQTIRANITTLDKESQKSYLQANQNTYRTLADLLIQQGRLGEAEAVLALLKEAEYRQFNEGDRALVTQPNAPVPLTTDEAQWQADYASLGDTLERLNQQATGLAKLDTRTPAQEAQYRALSAKLDKADAAFQTFLGRLSAHFTDAAKGNAAVLTVQQDQKMQNALMRWAKSGIRVAALYTVEADTQYAVILVTPNGSRPGATAITAADLNRKIAAFRRALTNKDVDPRPLGQALYRILIGPVEKDLLAYKPQVVMWSLDGLIRYLPVAALYDGRGYLVERWQNTLFDPASLTDLDQTRADWHQAQALGLGVSLEHHVKNATQDDEFPALTHVPEELNGIIRDPMRAGASGVLRGQMRLDADFTRVDTLEALRAHSHPVVHIATHFLFDAAEAERSYLLLGDGGQISLADLRRPGLFRGVDLLTLSACSTAMGQANADGKEVDSLGRTAEDDGAQAVIASLWSVSDSSTALLMQILYRDLQRNPSETKAAALQAAQLSLLHGAATPSGPTTRSAAPTSDRPIDRILPPFVPDPKAPYAHPFYWAPFVLIGNWR